MAAKRSFFKASFISRVIIGLALGVCLGLILGKRAEGLGEWGALVIRLLKTFAAPLVFFAVAEAISRFEVKPRSACALVGICALNASVALAVALSLTHLLRPGAQPEGGALLAMSEFALKPGSAEKLGEDLKGLELSGISFAKTLVPQSILEPFTSGSILSVVFLAIVFGLALRSLKKRAASAWVGVDAFLTAGMRIVERILGMVIELIPFAVLAVTAKVVGVSGFKVFEALGALVLTVALGLGIQMFIYYPLVVWLRTGLVPWVWLKRIRAPVITALSTGSSLATLPITLRALEAELKVSEPNARLSACVGTNLNNDGIILYEAVAACFIAQLAGIALEPSQIVIIAAASVFAAMGIAGIPEAGLITLSLVLSTAGLPLTLVPLLLPVDWILGRLRAATNVSADMTNAVLLEGRVN